MDIMKIQLQMNEWFVTQVVVHVQVQQVVIVSNDFLTQQLTTSCLMNNVFLPVHLDFMAIQSIRNVQNAILFALNAMDLLLLTVQLAI